VPLHSISVPVWETFELSFYQCSVTCLDVTPELFSEMSRADLLQTDAKVSEHNHFTFRDPSQSNVAIFTTGFVNGIGEAWLDRLLACLPGFDSRQCHVFLVSIAF
jgi:hypothetical protein